VTEVRPDIVPVLASFDGTTDGVPGFRAEFPDAGGRHTTVRLAHTASHCRAHGGVGTAHTAARRSVRVGTAHAYV
jgi:hypothetical protein